MTMKMATKREVERIKARYTKGLRIELIHMDDPQAPPAGTRGTIITVDDVGDLVVAWGSCLGQWQWFERRARRGSSANHFRRTGEKRCGRKEP